MQGLANLKGVGPALAETLSKNGFTSTDQIAAATPEELTVIPGIGQARALMLITAAKAITPPPRPAASAPEDTDSAPSKAPQMKKKKKAKKASKKKTKSKKADAKKPKKSEKKKKTKKTDKKAARKSGKKKAKAKKAGKSKKK